MENITIYRVALGYLAEGPFTAGNLEDITDMYRSAEYFPCAWNDDVLKDFRISIFKNTACACIDIPQLQHWFNYSDVVRYLESIHAQVYVLSIPVDAIVRGRKQILCDLSQAVVLDTIPIEQLPIMEAQHGQPVYKNR